MTEKSERRIYHPVQKDYATFRTLAEETGGEHSVLEIELAPGGGNAMHYHTAFEERFEVLEGELTVKHGKETAVLREGESRTVPAGTVHAFSNPTDETVRFLVELRPGHTGFENALRIMYGLAADGRVNAKGIPTNPSHIAILGEMSDTKLPGLLAVLGPVFRILARRARKRGVEGELMERYCSREGW